MLSRFLDWDIWNKLSKKLAKYSHQAKLMLLQLGWMRLIRRWQISLRKIFEIIVTLLSGSSKHNRFSCKVWIQNFWFSEMHKLVFLNVCFKFRCKNGHPRGVARLLAPPFPCITKSFFEMAAMPFPCNGILVVVGNLPRIFELL